MHSALLPDDEAEVRIRTLPDGRCEARKGGHIVVASSAARARFMLAEIVGRTLTAPASANPVHLHRRKA